MQDLQGLLMVVYIAAFIISIAMILAILRIPSIARYQKAQMKLLALMAKDQGINTDAIKSIVARADDNYTDDKGFTEILHFIPKIQVKEVKTTPGPAIDLNDPENLKMVLEMYSKQNVGE